MTITTAAGTKVHCGECRSATLPHGMRNQRSVHHRRGCCRRSNALVRTALWMPLWACPYSTARFHHFRNTRSSLPRSARRYVANPHSLVDIALWMSLWACVHSTARIYPVRNTRSSLPRSARRYDNPPHSLAHIALWMPLWACPYSTAR